MAVREVALTRLEQGGQTERFEVRIGEPGREGSTAGEIPRTAAAACRVPGSPWRDPVGDQCRTATTWCFPLTPDGGPQSQPDPASESDQHLGLVVGCSRTVSRVPSATLPTITPEAIPPSPLLTSPPVLIAVAPCGGSQSCHAPATHSHSPVTPHDLPLT